MRVKRLLVAPEWFVSGCTAGQHRAYEVVEDPIPEGARIVDIIYKGGPGAFEIVIGHESFDDIPEGSDPPSICPVAKYVDVTP